MALEQLDLCAVTGDEVRTTTCYMCACRCGINVHLKDGKVRYIEGNRAHPVNKGVLCAKGASGILQVTSPSRLTAPLIRTGPRGSGQFREASWDEALGLAASWLSETRARDPRKLAFFTGRDQSQALTGWFAQQYGTPNFAAHGGFCSVNMAAAGLYTIGGSFWEFGEPDWERTRYFLLFGVAEDHASNPIKSALGKLKARGVKIVSINPIRTGYSAIADEWVAIRPGTDGLLVSALIHTLLATRRVDLDYLAAYTNADWLVIDDPGAADHGLFARDETGRPRRGGLHGRTKLPDGRHAVPVLEHLVARYLDPRWAPEAVAAETGVPAATIRRLAGELAHAAFEQAITLDQPWTDTSGRRHATTTGRPVAMHAMRGISAHANGFQTCRLIHVLQLLLGTIDCPGGFRFKPPFPRPCPPPNRPAGRPGTVSAGNPLTGAPLGFPQGPEDLLVEADGRPARIDKAYSWDAPLAAHGLMHTVIANAANADPYAIDVLFLYMANMAWNSAMNVPETLAHLTATDPGTGDYKIARIIYSDAFRSETVDYADLVLPDTTYLERWDCISLLDRPISDADGPADAIRQPILAPDRDVRTFQTVLLDLGARLSLPGFVDAGGAPRYANGYADYIANHERAPGIGPLAGFRGADGEAYGRGAPNPDQLARYIEAGCFHHHALPADQRFYRHANKGYLEWAQAMGYVPSAEPIVFQLYLEPLQKLRLAAEGHGRIQPPDSYRARIAAFLDPLPVWYPPEAVSNGDAPHTPEPRDHPYPFHAVTQRPMHLYHSWGTHNGWLRQITADNHLYIHTRRAADLDLADGDWAWIISQVGRVKARVRLMDGVNPDTVWTWNAVGRRAGAAGLPSDAPEATRGFLLNHVIADLLPAQPGGARFSNSDPVTGQAAWYDLRVRIERAADESGLTWPRFEARTAEAGT